MVMARLQINEYSNQVINVVKAKFNLHDKSEALNKLIDLVGEEFVEKEAKDDYVKKIIELEKKHFEKHGLRKMSKKQFNALFELN